MRIEGSASLASPIHLLWNFAKTKNHPESCQKVVKEICEEIKIVSRTEGCRKENGRQEGYEEKEGETLSMEGSEIKFETPAVLRKWPSLKNERVGASLGARPYIIFDGTLDECIQQFMSKPASQHHLYEIHTAPQAELITAVLSAEQIVELARLRDFL